MQKLSYAINENRRIIESISIPVVVYVRRQNLQD